MEGPFKGHAPTGEKIELYGMAIFTVNNWISYMIELEMTIYNLYLSLSLWSQLNEDKKIVKIEFFYDPAELLGGLIKGPIIDESDVGAASSCPVVGTG